MDEEIQSRLFLGNKITRRNLLRSTTGAFLFLNSPLVSAASGTSTNRTSKQLKLDENSQITKPSYLPYPSDPFILGQFADQYLSSTDRQGWEPVPINEEIHTLLRLHLDVLDSAPLASFENGELLPNSSASNALDFSLRTDVPATAGRNTTIEMGRVEEGSMEPILSEHDWTQPNGEPVTSVSENLAETIAGEDQYMEWTFTTNGIPSAFAPLGLHLMIKSTTERLEQGFAGFFVDMLFLFHGLDFSDWATTAFTKHLSSLPQSRLEELDIKAPSEFKVKEYLKQENLTPESDINPLEDPVFREFIVHNHLGVREFFADYRDAVSGSFPDRSTADEIALWANQFVGSLYNPQAVNVYVSDFLDLINTEHFPTVNEPSDHKYKLLKANGRFSKPVIAKATITKSPGSEEYPGFDPTKSYPMLQRYQVAEAFANGARLKIPLSPRGAHSTNESITQWIQADGNVPSELQEFIDFVWAHKRFLTDEEPNHPVAVIWSLPDRMFRKLPQWDIEPREQSQSGVSSFNGTTTLLREAQIPYTVLTFGHPRLWEDTDLLEGLQEYEVIILPNVRSLSEAQLSALSDYVDQGGHLVANGQTPDRTANFAPLNNLDGLFEKDRAIVLSGDPGSYREEKGQAKGSLYSELEKIDVNPIIPNDNTSLSVNIRQQSENNRTIVHLLNHDYSRQTDSFDPIRDIPVTVPNLGHDVSAVQFFSPQKSKTLDFESGGNNIQFTVPEIVDWGFVVLATSESSIFPTENKNDAQKKVQQAEETLAKATDEGFDWSPESTIAEAELENARIAFDHQAYGQAVEAAEAAHSAAAETTYPRPTIALDLAHSQSSSYDGELQGEPLEDLKNEFQHLDYRLIDSWSEDELADVDVLIVPPALRYKGESFGFKDSEIDQIVSFVEGGGSLAILARGAVARDIDDLTEQFGYRFDGSSIQFPEGIEEYATVTDPLHPLTRGVRRFYVDWGTPITQMPDDATVLATVGKETGAWLHDETPHDTRQEGEKLLQKDPIYAVSKQGLGRVAVLGQWAYLYHEGLHHWKALTGNLVSFLGQSAAATQAESVETNPTSTDVSNETTETTPTPTDVSNETTETTDETAPGFGFGTGIAGLVGTGYFLHRLRDTDQD
ncbi:MAG: hypothetical protein U5K70_07475 [Halodesulfurarchaeum sp.]|nr:hypothetical protein [Halodesulfurarchaeum sp.]